MGGAGEWVKVTFESATILVGEERIVLTEENAGSFYEDVRAASPPGGKFFLVASTVIKLRDRLLKLKEFKEEA